jgi:hypothetical protein
MRFVLLFLLIVLICLGLAQREVREAIGFFLKKTWLALVVAALVSVVLFVFAYSGNALFLF